MGSMSKSKCNSKNCNYPYRMNYPSHIAFVYVVIELSSQAREKCGVLAVANFISSRFLLHPCIHELIEKINVSLSLVAMNLESLNC